MDGKGFLLFKGIKRKIKYRKGKSVLNLKQKQK